MRRNAGHLLLGLGAFLLTMAVLVKWYAYPNLAVAPLDTESETSLIGEDVTYFSRADRVEKTDDLSVTVRVIGDVKTAEEEGDGIAVYDDSTKIVSSDGTVQSVETARAAFDRVTGVAVNCCDSHVNEEPTDVSGQVYKFPFGTEKKTYEYWDGSLRQAVPIDFQAEEEIDGLTVYRFGHTIEPTKVSEIDLPGDLLGEDPKQVLTGEQFYANTRTMWIEPTTGAVVKVTEEQDSTIRYDGTDRIVATRGTISFTDEQVAKNVEEYSAKASQLKLLSVWLPLGGLVLGLLLLALGVLLSRGGGSSGSRAATTGASRPVTAGKRSAV